ncbi:MULTISPECIES: peroxiredoxin [unclassified Aureispira]|uniref:peroxiredoxin family protein n=1 Tax=unclassified Aureispira TaxID=2649989 RepID=UPI000697E660|nr:MULTISPECIES: TlpA disulfide reductase family protein [unclassified Aureispira]WMX14186.1 TlpA disulfide reductase family protein [Aureispira sp. CCB-E]
MTRFKKYILVWAACCWFIGCQSSSNISVNNNRNTGKVDKGEQEFQAYLDRKKNKYIGTKVPELVLKTLKGKTYNLADMGGKIVLLNFWFAACKPCITEISSLNELQEQYKSKNLVVLSVGTDKKEVAEKLVTEKNMRYPVVADRADIAKQMDVSTYPTSFLIDQKGVIQQVFIGASAFDATHTYTEVKPHIERLIKK